MFYLTSDLRREGSRWLHRATGHIYLLALTCLPCFLPESNSHVGLGRGQGPELAAIQWARSSNSSTVEMLFMHPHKNSWRPALHSRPEVSAFTRIGPLSLHQRTLGKCLMNSGQKCADVQIPAASHFCPSWLCIWFGHICIYGDASLVYPEHEKALLFLHLSQGCIYEGVTIWTGTQKLANTQ